jgi:hypothetical protein
MYLGNDARVEKACNRSEPPRTALGLAHCHHHGLAAERSSLNGFLRSHSNQGVAALSTSYRMNLINVSQVNWLEL